MALNEENVVYTVEDKKFCIVEHFVGCYVVWRDILKVVRFVAVCFCVGTFRR
jgi:hypothetical protein